jgi:hypothetical protein
MEKELVSTIGTYGRGALFGSEADAHFLTTNPKQILLGSSLVIKIQAGSHMSIQ